VEGLSPYSAPPNPQPNFDWRGKKQTGRKVRGGVEGGGKKFEEGRFGGIAPPHPTGAWKGEDLGDRRRPERMGLLVGYPEQTPPKAGGDGVQGHPGARRTGEELGAQGSPGQTAPEQSRASYLPPASVPAASSLASLYFAPVPLLAPQPRAARGGPLSFLPLWVSSASRPVAPRTSLGLCAPDDPPCNSSTTGRRPPSLGGRYGALCRLV
jgi:hypothetical protein